MKIYNTKKGIVIKYKGEFFLSTFQNWDLFTNRIGLHNKVLEELSLITADPSLSEAINRSLLPPIGSQEVWASGVTYIRSREARIEEAKVAGGGDFYSRVYDAVRPELFMKSTASRVVGPGEKVRIRKDSKWNVPEPELTLFISSQETIEAYTIGNDMSSRDIEGENPLYLPQAKCYDAAAALGPCLFVPGAPIDPATLIQISINRKGSQIFSGTIAIDQMKRKHTELAEFLFRETSFPSGVYLMTGTGIVPPDDFSLQPEDEIIITIDGIGKLVNTVTQW